jgi:hypothetical protein
MYLILMRLIYGLSRSGKNPTDMGTVHKEVRFRIYEGFAKYGAPPTPEDLARDTSLTISEIQTVLQELATTRNIVINEHYRILMAHPFSSIPLGFSVMGTSTLWWGGCAWDSFALPNLLSTEVVVATTCLNCSQSHSWRVDPDTPPQGQQIAHFLIPTSRMWDDVIHTCGNQRIFCDELCLKKWLKNSGNDYGYSMNLETLWNLSRSWYEGRLNYEYERRDPSAALDYFKSVGLRGEFWGIK